MLKWILLLYPEKSTFTMTGWGGGCCLFVFNFFVLTQGHFLLPLEREREMKGEKERKRN